MSLLLLLLPAPALAAPDTQVRSGGSSFGASLAHGDLDGDGYQDVIVGEPDWDRVEVFYGRPSGMAPSPHHLPAPSSQQGFGEHVASGDWNGDGYADLVVAGARGVYLYYGHDGKLDPTPSQHLEDAILTLASVGDIDRDGYADLAVVSQQGQTPALLLLYGSKDGLNERSLVQTPGLALERFGVALAGVGDLDGDGYPEMAVSSQSESLAGQVHIFYGGVSTPEGGAAIERPSGISEQSFGLLLAGAGDLDDDGYDELLVGALGPDGASVALLWGSSAGPRQGLVIKLPSSDTGLVQAIAGVGDVSADGTPDLVLGTPDSDAVTLVLGGEQQPLQQLRIADLDLVSPGLTVAPAGDVNGDGVADYLVAGEGAVALVFGGCIDQDLDGVCQGVDCDDQDPEVHPDAEEVCDDIDNDCDGTVDGALAKGATRWHVDQDQDGYTLEESTAACEAPAGYSEESEELDCDDTDPQVYPDAEELPDDGVDQDCDGQDISSSGAALMAGETGGVAGCRTGSGQGSPWWIVVMGLVGVVLSRYSPKSSG